MSLYILFYQQYAVPYFGIISLDARLKRSGYKTDVIIDALEKDPAQKIQELNPDLIGFSVLSTEHSWLRKTTKMIHSRFPNIPIIVGGIHAMIYPERILADTPAVLVCHSEGEEVILNVLKEMDKSLQGWSAVKGIAFRDINGQIHKNERATLVQYDNSIIENRDIYYNRYPVLARDMVHRFFSSRGCPYSCSFCYNSYLRKLFRGKGRFVRQKSVDSFIREIALQSSKYNMKSIFFYDDLFTYNKKWIREFLNEYKRNIGIPFMCTTRANLIDEETVSLLAKAGCRTASFGIETGNRILRNNILKKKITDEEIIHCGRTLQKHGIQVQTANMFCLPGETLKDALKTVELNIRAKTRCAFSALFMPFPYTEICEYCKKKKLISQDYSLNDIPYSFLTNSVLDIPQKTEIMNVHYLCHIFVRYPFTYKIFKNLVNIRWLNKIYYYIFLLGNFLRHKEERGIGWCAALRYAWRMRDTF